MAHEALLRDLIACDTLDARERNPMMGPMKLIDPELFNRLREALSAQPAEPKQEVAWDENKQCPWCDDTQEEAMDRYRETPVAWMYECKETGVQSYMNTRHEMLGYTITPLYAAPPAAEPKDDPNFAEFRTSVLNHDFHNPKPAPPAAEAKQQTEDTLPASVGGAAAPRMPAEAFPVGDFVAEELEARGWTIADLAERMDGNFSVNHLAVELMIYAGREPGIYLSNESASQLAKAFGVSAQFFLAIDRGFRLWRDSDGKPKKMIVELADPKDEQVERLAEDLRDHTAPEYIDGKPSGTAFDHTLMDAADLLESQARQIATLKAEIEDAGREALRIFTATRTLTAERDQLKKAMKVSEQDESDMNTCWKVMKAERDRAVEALRKIQTDIKKTLEEGKAMYPKIAYVFDALISRYDALAASLQPKIPDHQPLDSEAKT